MNNNFSAIARYLSDEGFNVKLLRYRNEPDHFSPEHDVWEQWSIETQFVNWDSVNKYFSISKREVIKDLEGADFVIACGPGISFLYRSKIQIDIVIPYGSDTYQLPFHEFSRNPLYLIKRTLFGLSQRKGIRRANTVILEGLNPEVENRINVLKLHQRVRMSIPMLHGPSYSLMSHTFLKGPVELEYERAYKNSSFVIFHHSRHSWKTNIDKVEYKGNDIFLKGAGRFIKQNPSLNIRIITMEYGRDVDNSKSLIKDLGIEENVFWFPLQKRKEIMFGLSRANVVVGELGQSFNLYGIIVEAMCSEVPIIHSRTDILYKEDYKTLYPMYNANSEFDVQARLQEILENPEEAKTIGKNSMKWYEKNIVEPFKLLIQKQVLYKFSSENT